jgi:hypothetical protein
VWFEPQEYVVMAYDKQDARRIAYKKLVEIPALRFVQKEATNVEES